MSQSSQGPIQRKKTQETTLCRIGCKQLRKTQSTNHSQVIQSEAALRMKENRLTFFSSKRITINGSNNSKPPSAHNVLSHSPADPQCETCTMTRTTRARCQDSPEIRGDGIELLKKNFGEVVTADHKVLIEESDSILQNRCAVVIQKHLCYGIQS